MDDQRRMTFVIRCKCGHNLIEVMTEDGEMPRIFRTIGCELTAKCKQCGEISYMEFNHPLSMVILPKKLENVAEYISKFEGQ